MKGEQQTHTRCLIAGGGPAGMMLGYLLARAGVGVVVLEKHGDFLRDFRGDTVHPSTLEILDEVDLLSSFDRLPQQRVQRLGVRIGDRFQPVVDFHGLKPFDYLSLVPQWDFLNLLAEAGSEFAHFDLRMRHEAVGLIQDRGRVTGLRVRSPEGESDFRADLIVACDGRQSELAAAAGLTPVEFGAPMDALWFRLPRCSDDPEDTFAVLGPAQMMVLLNRGDYWQAAYVVAKGSDSRLRAQPVETLRQTIAQLAPFLNCASDVPASWDDVKTLEVRVDRLQRWHVPGLLVIGDAAHAMSPIGGVGINLAIQDAVAAANDLTPALRRDGPVDEAILHKVQKRRMVPTRLTQLLQLQIQKRIITRALAESDEAPEVNPVLRWLLGFRFVRRIPARLIGYGFRREHVRYD